MKAKIFLADERGKIENDTQRSCATFNSGSFFNEHKHPFASLYVLNDETLAGGCSLTMQVQEDSWILLLPVVGNIYFEDKSGKRIIIHPGQLFRHYSKQGSFILSNPYTDELINFLQIWIRADYAGNSDQILLQNFMLDENKNQLIHLISGITANSHNLLSHPSISIGKFTGRKEAVYTLKRKENHLFIFVIEGVFEVQGRLLHQRDGLALWNAAEDIELEALSNDAIILLLEMQ